MSHWSSRTDNNWVNYDQNTQSDRQFTSGNSKPAIKNRQMHRHFGPATGQTMCVCIPLQMSHWSFRTDKNWTSYDQNTQSDRQYTSGNSKPAMKNRQMHRHFGPATSWTMCPSAYSFKMSHWSSRMDKNWVSYDQNTQSDRQYTSGNSKPAMKNRQMHRHFGPATGRTMCPSAYPFKWVIAHPERTRTEWVMIKIHSLIGNLPLATQNRQ